MSCLLAQIQDSNDVLSTVVYTCADALDLMLSEAPESVPSSFGSELSISFPVWIRRIITKSETSPQVAFVALYYLVKLQSLHPQLQFSLSNIYRSFLTAFMLAAKFCEDTTYDNAAWRIIGYSHYSTRLINSMESEFLSLLGWNLCITSHELEAFVSALNVHKCI
ncbi:hypothetical protein RCL1_004091 [Eukaryota sp. TZLM3-RCL]